MISDLLSLPIVQDTIFFGLLLRLCMHVYSDFVAPFLSNEFLEKRKEQETLVASTKSTISDFVHKTEELQAVVTLAEETEHKLCLWLKALEKKQQDIAQGEKAACKRLALQREEKKAKLLNVAKSRQAAMALNTQVLQAFLSEANGDRGQARFSALISNLKA